MASSDKIEPDSVYQLKVTLEGTRPPIWRRIQVQGNITLFKLHEILQVIMSWEDYHLHVFRVGDVCYAIPSPDDPWPIETKNEKRTKLFQIAPAENAIFSYEYDLGDSWSHDILVEKILYPEERLKHPICIKGRRAGPPEDCGGVPGYYDFLETIMTPLILNTRICWRGPEENLTQRSST